MKKHLVKDWLRSSDLEEMLSDVIGILRKFMGDKTFIVSHVSGNHLEIVQSNIGSLLINSKLESFMNQTVFQKAEMTESVIIADTSLIPEIKHACNYFGIGSYLEVPLILNDGEFVGMISVLDKEPYVFKEIEVETLKVFAKILMKSFHLHQLSILDYITGLYNKSLIDRKMSEVQDSIKDEVITVVLFDVDDFKKINDTYGHSVGDQVLKFIGECVREIMPKNAIPFRFGGDEFFIIIPGVKSNEIVEHINLLQQAVSTHPKSNFSLSIGISDTTKADLNEIIDTADKAMYYAKDQGKNQYSIYKTSEQVT